MNDSEFLELLNLYLDHEISAADAARLEAEVSTHPARRKVYDDYCRMHKACSLVAMDFSTVDGSVVAASDKVVPFDFGAAQAAARRRRVAGYLSGGLAAAACAAVALVGFRAFTVTPQGTDRLAVADGVAIRAGDSAVVHATPVAPDLSAPGRSRELGGGALARAASSETRTAPKWVNAPLVLSEHKADAVMTAALRQAEDQLAWIHSVQFSPMQSRLQLEQIRFDAQPTSLQPDGRALGVRPVPAVDQTAEMAAFRFVK